MLSTTEIEESFLRKLFRTKRIGAKYMPEVYVLKRMKNWEFEDQRKGKDIWEDLIKSGIVLLKGGKSERLVRLNPRRLKEVRRKLT